MLVVETSQYTQFTGVHAGIIKCQCRCAQHSVCL